MGSFTPGKLFAGKVRGQSVDIGKEKSLADFGLRDFFLPRNAVPKVRVELTLGHLYRFLSLARVVLISVIRRVLVQPPEYLPQAFVPKRLVMPYGVIRFVINSVIKFS